MKKTLLLTAVAVLFLVNITLAASDTVVLVTDMTSVDATTASAAASKAGIPVVVLEGGTLTDAIKSDLQAQGFKNAVLVGGPAVIKPEVETQLRSLGYNVVRLWGYERTGTAIEVARYFWPAGANCTVLVDDTKNSDADARSQMEASNLAGRKGCALIPVPEGTVPAEVLSLLKDLGVTDVKFVGKKTNSDVEGKLREFSVSEIIGSDDQLENQIENEAMANTTKNLKLVVVAVPDWRSGIGIASNPKQVSVVRMISNINQVDPLIDLVKTKNITDVRVVGLPDLAKQVADKFNQSNISVTLVSGQKASDISRELLKQVKAELDEKKRAEDSDNIKYRLKIKAFLENDTNATIARLDEALAKLDAMAQSAETDNARAAIEAAIANITQVKQLIQSGNLDDAKKLLYQLKFTADEKNFVFRDKLNVKIDDEIADEENGIDKAQSNADKTLAEVESALSEIKAKCKNPEIVDALVTKAKSLRTSIQEAKASGNFGAASEQLMQVRELVSIARSTGEICRKTGDLPERMKTDTTVLRGNDEGPAVNPPGDMQFVEGNTIVMTLDGFMPNALKVAKGTTVTFVNNGTADQWPASAKHPNHTVYPGSGIEKCGTPDQPKIFDACGNITAGQSWSFTFNEVGTWAYHDHLHPTLFGRVLVTG